MRDRAASPRTVIAVCTMAVGTGAAIGFLHGYLAPALREDLGITRTQIGVLVSVYFGSTGLGSVGGGMISDRVGARLSVVIDLAIVAASALLLVLFPTYASLLVASLAGGLAYSLANSGTNMAIGVAVPPGRRGLALTVKTGGVPAMATIAALAAPWAAERVGWRPVIAVVAILAAAIAILALIVLPDDRPVRRQSPHGPLPAGFLWFPVAAFLLITGSQPLFSWSVSWFGEAQGTSVGAAGALSALATAAGLVGMILIGRRSDTEGGPRRTTVISLMTLICAGATGMLMVGATVGVILGTAALCLAMATQLGAIGVMHAAVVDAVPNAIGRASGVTMTGYYLGALVSPAVFGLLIDTTGGYGVPWGLCALSLLGASAAFRRAGSVIATVPATRCVDGPTGV